MEASVFPMAPLLGLVLPNVRSNLVSHASQHIRRSFRGNNQRLHHGRRDLAQDFAHGPGDPSALVLPGRGLIDGVSRVCDALKGEAERAVNCWSETLSHPTVHTLVELFNTIFVSRQKSVLLS